MQDVIAFVAAELAEARADFAVARRYGDSTRFSARANVAFWGDVQAAITA
jgi:hypothetical protein